MADETPKAPKLPHTIDIGGVKYEVDDTIHEVDAPATAGVPGAKMRVKYATHEGKRVRLLVDVVVPGGAPVGVPSGFPEDVYRLAAANATR
ncbi:MAG TPA: hypothetical protein PKI27_01095 [Dermatophilaceae bacterium]|jgi:hypothetical protein|nr:hypothetical protein [Dermatophilaceae bacterium]